MDMYGENQPLRGQNLDEKMDIQVRHGFVKKVFGLVSVQLAITTLIATPFVVYNASARMFIMQNQGLVMFASFFPLILLCVAMCNPSMTREYPKNYLFLALITLCFGFIVGVTCSMYKTESIVLAAGLTAGITVSLTAFAMQTKYDFTSFYPYLWSAFMVMFFIGIVMMFLPYSRTTEVIYSAGMCLIFSFYIIFDVQMMVGGKHNKYQFAIDDYVFAALNLYLDIINLFLHLLRIIGERR